MWFANLICVLQAVMEFYKRHLCRVWPFPPDVQASLDWLEKDNTVYMTMCVDQCTNVCASG